MSTNTVSLKTQELPIVRIMLASMVTTLFLMVTAIIITTGGPAIVAFITAIVTVVAAVGMVRTIVKL